MELAFRNLVPMALMYFLYGSVVDIVVVGLGVWGILKLMCIRVVVVVVGCVSVEFVICV
jgi:hypothetical protein